MKTFNKIIFIFILELLTIFFIWQAAGRFVWADVYYKHLIIAKIKKDWPSMLSDYQKIFFYDPNEFFYQTRYAKDLIWAVDLYHDKKGKIVILNQAINELEKINKERETFQADLILFPAYAQKANLTLDEKDFQKADESFKHLKELSPNYPHYYKDWAQLKFYELNDEEAEELCLEALKLYPDVNEARLNEVHKAQLAKKRAEIYGLLGDIYFERKQYKEADEFYRQAIKLSPFEESSLYKKIADIYYLEKNFEKAIGMNIHGFNLNPKDPIWSYSISFLYNEALDRGEAKKWAKICQELKPEDLEIQNYLKNF